MHDIDTESNILAHVIQNGSDAFINLEEHVDTNDFSNNANRSIWLALKEVSSKECESVDANLVVETIDQLKIPITNRKKMLDYIQSLHERNNISREAIILSCGRIRSLRIKRDLLSKYARNVDYLDKNPDDSIEDIIKRCESDVVDYLANVSQGDKIVKLTDKISARINHLMTMEMVDQVGIPTGFPLWDRVIGGGPRPGTVHVLASRPKVGKSFLGMNMAMNSASRGVPTLVIDTELTEDYQMDRMVCINSSCPISLYETGKFRLNPTHVENVRAAAENLSNLPLYYESTAGMTFAQMMAAIKLFLVKKVGFDRHGKAQPCMIVYDYIKLTSGAGLNNHTPEYLLLGLMVTELHNFAVKYGVPIVVFCQTNRDGIDVENTSIISGSDRILWLCSSMSIFKNKSETDEASGCGWAYGNKKLIVLETRQGAGMPTENDYINLHASLRPGFDESRACGMVREGLFASSVQVTNNVHLTENDSRES